LDTQAVLAELLHIIFLAGAICLESLAIGLPLAAMARRLRSCPEEAELPFIFLCAGAAPAFLAFAAFLVQGRCSSYVLFLAAISAILGWLLTFRDCLALLRRQWRPLVFLGLIYCAWVGHQALLRSCTGPFWYGDWYLHYSFAQHFHEGPDQMAARMLGRTWLCSLFGAFHLAHWPKEGFRVFQLSIPFLALASAAAGGQLVVLLFRRGGSVRWLFWLLFPFIPSFTQNACYTWPKLFMAGCVLTYVLIRLISLREEEGPFRLSALAGICAACGFLAHASALAYVLAAEAALAFYSRHRPLNLVKHWAVLALAALLILQLYYAWLASLYRWDEILGGFATSRGSTLQQKFEQARDNFRSTLLPYAFVKDRLVPWDQTTSYQKVQATLRIACDSFLGLIGPLGWLFFFLSFFRTRKEWLYRRLLEAGPFTALFMAVGGGALCLFFHAGYDNKGMMSIALLPGAIVLLGLIAAQFHRDTQVYQWLGLGAIMLYGAVLRAVSILYQRNGVLLDRNYYFLQKGNQIRLWYDELSVVSLWMIAVAVLACMTVMVLLAIRWQGSEEDATQ